MPFLQPRLRSLGWKLMLGCEKRPRGRQSFRNGRRLQARWWVIRWTREAGGPRPTAPALGDLTITRKKGEPVKTQDWRSRISDIERHLSSGSRHNEPGGFLSEVEVRKPLSCESLTVRRQIRLIPKERER